MSTHSIRKSEASRERILQAAGKAFRSAGFGGTGVDGLAKGADLTSGAFYFHFKSKLDVFVAALRHGISELREGVMALQTQKGTRWLSAWVDYYLGFKRTCALDEGCSFPALAPEVERAGEEAQAAYEVELQSLIRVVAAGLEGRSSQAKRERAIVLLATLSGGINMARAVKSSELSGEIARVLRRAVLTGNGAVESSISSPRSAPVK